MCSTFATQVAQKGIKLMTKEELIVALVDRINELVNVPLIGESMEAVAIRQVIEPVVDLIPESILVFIMDASAGIDLSELSRLVDVLVAVVNKYIDVPKMSEDLESKWIRLVIETVLELAQSGKSITT
jgi:hypothetical protein